MANESELNLLLRPAVAASVRTQELRVRPN